MSAALTLDGVSARFGPREALGAIDLDLQPGVTGLVGRNGAGKTTLLRVVIGVLKPAGGCVLRDGSDVHANQVAMAVHRRDLGWLPQEARMPPRMTVADVLSYSSWLKEIPTRRCESAVADALDVTDLGDLRARRLGSLSGGQRRRAALAAAVVGRPSLLLLDEPTNGLDPVQRSQFLGRVRSMAADCTVLVATHLLEDLELSADRWVALDSGAVVAGGDVDRRSDGSLMRTRTAVRHALDPGLNQGVS